MEKMEHAMAAAGEQQERQEAIQGARHKQEQPPPPPPRRVRVFPCRFCGRVFLSPRAMGGHQNAHRRDREAPQLSHSHKPVAVGQENLHGVDVLGPSPPLVYEDEEALSSSTSRPGSSAMRTQPEPEPAGSDDLDLSLRL